MPANVFRFDEAEVDEGRYELRRQGRMVKLEKIPMELLLLLLGRRGELVTREEIIARLWGKDVFVDTEQGINTAIRKIRQALRDDPEQPRFVQTVVGKGYRFVAPVTVVGSATEGPPGRTMPAERGRRWWIGAVATAALLAVLVAVWPSGWRGRLFGRGDRPIRSIAVLPLENLSGNPAEEYFADGMTDALITYLAQVSALRVISRTSVMRYKGAKRPLAEIARELNVDAVVEGSVVRSSNRVRINAQLIQAVPEHHLWASVYERDLADVVALQGDVARAIATEIQIKLTPQEQTRLARAQPLAPEALEAYLKGRYEWSKWTEEGLKKSIEYFEQAIQKESAYAQAWAGLADAYGLLGDLQFEPRQVALPKAKAAALRALELDETLSEAHVSLGGVLLHLEWSWSESERELQRAIALSPNNATAHQWHGYYLRAMGRFDDAIAEMKRARELDPFSPNKQNALGAAFYEAGRYDEALQQFREVPDPNATSVLRHRRMAAIYERKGMQKEATAELLAALRVGGKNRLATVIERKYLSSGYPEARKTFLWGDIGEIQQRGRNGFLQAYWIAADYALLGEKNKAFEWLEKAFRERDVSLIYLKVDESFQALRPDPRFQDLLRRMGLPP